ncbi:MAG: AAA family ATPase [Helicobacteraceae bacterium]|jgi:chromosome partitioning protein|nr:AAA family ATPase [Helicobacteraceae bacterium]
MSEVIAIANQKGGVGKTTTAVNLGASLAVSEKRTLIIDADPQANATSHYGFRRNSYEFNIYDVLRGTKDLRDVVLKTALPNLELAPSNIGLVGLEKELYSKDYAQKEMILREKIKPLRDNYDYIIIDTPPTLGLITINALCAADSVIIPIQCEYFAMEGLAQLFTTVKMVKNKNPSLRVRGFLPTMFTPNNNLSKQVFSELKEHYPSELFPNLAGEDECGDEYIYIPRNVKLAESPSFGKPVILYDVKSVGSAAYQNLAGAILSGNNPIATRGAKVG